MINSFLSFIQDYIAGIHMPRIRVTDIIEVLIITFLIYHLMVWVRGTKAWSLLKGLIVILGFLLLAAIFNMSTILWIAEKSLSMMVIAIVVVLQPELRRALEQLGQKNILFSFMNYDSGRQGGRYSDHTIDEIVKASFAMGRVKTGALMVLERNESLAEYEKTGIAIDAAVSSQLLINIFEHNTPLHDGAVIIKGDRITAATCYLPLSDNRELSKELGTRHRAGVGISEVTDSFTIIVSEETGAISIAYKAELERAVTPERLRERLTILQNKSSGQNKWIWPWKGRVKNEK